MSAPAANVPGPSGGVGHEAQAGAHAAGRLRGMIADGVLPPGAKLSEQKVAAELGISRNTLRESFSMLAAEGLVRRVPHRGVTVAEPTAEDVRDLYAARLVLEPEALLRGELDDAAVGRLRSVVTTALDAVAAGDVPGMSDANQRFHRELVAAAGSATLLTEMDRMLARMRLVFHAMSGDSGFHARYAQDNAEVLEALGTGDREAAARLLRRSLENARDEVLEQLG